MQITKITLMYLFVVVGYLHSSLTLCSDNPANLTLKKSAALIEVAHNYLKFIHDVGSAESVEDTDTRLQTLFSRNLTKNDNHTTLFIGNRDCLLPQMKGPKKTDAPEKKTLAWVVDIEKAYIVPSAETNTVVAYFQWNHINIGYAATMAMLKVNDDNQITLITNVSAKIKE